MSGTINLPSACVGSEASKEVAALKELRGNRMPPPPSAAFACACRVGANKGNDADRFLEGRTVSFFKKIFLSLAAYIFSVVEAQYISTAKGWC